MQRLRAILLSSKSRDTGSCDGKIKKLEAAKSLRNIINDTHIA